MKKAVGLLNLLAQQRDLLLIVVLMLVLLMMFLPLPSFLMDVLQTLNIASSIIILLMCLQIRSAVQFSTFPSLLLITTLFRLGLAIASTRLILLEADAGQIVQTFGEVVIGGNLVVGMVIFLIITIVQFIVITKGADRVAEVGARFTLDGMPGKQMAVDADVRAGNIDKVDARIARETVEREAKLFGAMDGAMKFVKGDAVASLIITAVNLLGGITVGMMQQNMPFSDALELYSVLTIGDGLLGQIPALMISVAAGTIVTRVTNPDGIDLGTEIGDQITGNSKTVIYSGLVIAAFGFVPGFPKLIFFVIGLGMVGGLLLGKNRTQKAEKASLKTWIGMKQINDMHCDDVERRSGTPSPVKLIIPIAFQSINPQTFFRLFEEVNRTMQAEFGIPMGLWRFDFGTQSTDEYKIMIKGDVITTGRVRMDCVFVKANASYLDALGIPFVLHFGTEEGVLVGLDQLGRLQSEKISYWDQIDMVIMDLKRTIANNLDLLVGFQATSNILDDLGRTNPVLAADLRDNLSVNQISAVLKLLVQERIPMTSRVRIFESILETAPRKPDPFHVLQSARIAIGDFITLRFASDGFMPVVILAPSLESFIREGFRTANEENYLILDSDISSTIASQVKSLTQDVYKRGRDPVILTQQDIRRAVHNVLHEHGIFVPVLAYQEITPQTIIYPIGFISAEDQSAAA